MKRAVIIARPNTHQERFGRAFAAGLRRHGWSAELSRTHSPCDLVVMWGVRNVGAIEAQKRARKQVCVLERGYIGNRFEWTSVSFGGLLNGRANFRLAADVPNYAARFWDNHGNLFRPWQPDAKKVLIIGQKSGDMSHKHLNIKAWYTQTADTLNAAGFDVYFRPHPREYGLPFIPRGAKRFQRELLDLDGFGLVATCNSNAGVETVLHGVPTVSADVGSMAYPVSTANPLQPYRPGRAEWAQRLAWCQWLDSEMESGFCWSMVSGV